MIEIQNYNPQWKNRFQSLSSNFMPYISDMIEEVIHVGSTSIEGMSAKPVIDIDIVVENFDNFDQLCEKLKIAGYQHVGNRGITDRETFVHTKTTPHHLYVVKKNSLALKNHLLLKKHLQENPAAQAEYTALKNLLSNKKINREKYCKGKTQLILSYLAAEGLSDDELEIIKEQNLA